MKTLCRIQTTLPAEHPSECSDWLVDQCRQVPGHPLYALVDGGQIEDLPAKMRRWAPRASVSLFSVSGKNHLDDAGGWLVDLELDGGASNKRLDSLCEEAMERPAVMWFQSPLGLRELQELLASRLDVQLDRNREAFFRYYDPRIFTNLIEVLKPEQLPFLSMASRWYWFDHAYNRCVLEMPLDTKGASMFNTPTQFGPGQEKALIELSLPYEMMEILEDEDPATMGAVPLHERYGLLKQGVDKSLAEGHWGRVEMAEACQAVLEGRMGEQP